MKENRAYGGFNTGGGIVLLSSYLLDSPAFNRRLSTSWATASAYHMSTLYGYDQARGLSIMSYNQDHLTNHFQQAPSPGTLIAEDVQGLSVNHRVFPDLEPVGRARSPLPAPCSLLAGHAVVVVLRP